jgi:hypothetical protein
VGVCPSSGTSKGRTHSGTSKRRRDLAFSSIFFIQEYIYQVCAAEVGRLIHRWVCRSVITGKLAPTLALYKRNGDYMNDVKVKVLLLICIIASVLNADLTKNLAITCGTKGIGPRYSIYYKSIGADFGFPLYLSLAKNKNNDTVETSDVFSCNTYGNLDFIVYQRLLYDFVVGISLFGAISYEYNEVSFDTTDLISSGLNLDFTWGPCFQYTRRNKNCNKLFSIEFWPIVITQNIQNRLKVAANVQLSYYL